MAGEKIKDINKIPALLTRIRNLEVVDKTDIDEINHIVVSIFDEWRKLNSKFKRRLLKKNLYILNIYYAHEVDEEIIFGLITLLNEKITGYLKY